MNWDDQKMNQLCKVCGEPAAGYHFGAFTCEGCKSFFGRTYNNLTALGDCKNNGQCVINKKNRTSCKSCRLKKCLMVGMSKSGSRYGRRSNWFKIHCLIQDQAEMTNKIGERHHTSAAGLLEKLHGSLGGNVQVSGKHQHQHSLHYYDGKDNSSSSAASPTGSASSPSDIGAPTLVGPTGKPYSLFDALPNGNKHGNTNVPSRNGSYESSTSPPYDRKDTIVFHPLPLSPVSPLHHPGNMGSNGSKFFFHPSANGNGTTSLFTKSLHHHGNGKVFHHSHHSPHTTSLHSPHLPLGSPPMPASGSPSPDYVTGESISPRHSYGHHHHHLLSQPYSQRYLSALSSTLLSTPSVRGLPELAPASLAMDSSYAEVPLQDSPMDLTIGKTIHLSSNDRRRRRGRGYSDSEEELDMEEDDDEDGFESSKGRKGRKGHGFRIPRDGGNEGDDEDDSEGPAEGETPVETPLDLTGFKRITPHHS